MNALPRFAALALLQVLVSPLAALAETAADRFQPVRGLNFETWNEWLSTEEMVTRPGFLDAYPDWRRKVPLEDLTMISGMGFDFVRIPFDPAPLLRLGPGAEQDRLIGEIRQVADAALRADLRVIVDLHAIPRPDEAWGTESIVREPELFAAYTALVQRIAAALDGIDADRVALELLNEPTHDCAVMGDARKMQWPGQLKTLHAAAREGAPDIPLVLSGACWGNVWALRALDPAAIGDDNVLWSFHSYGPFLFTHQAAGWSDWPGRFLVGLPYPPDTLDDATAERLLAEALRRAKLDGKDDALFSDIARELRDYRDTPLAEAIGGELQDAAAWADRHGIPRHRLIMGEFGAIRYDLDGRRFTGLGQDRFLEDKRRAAEDLGFGWAVWSWTGSLGIAADAETRALAPETCAALGLSGC